jgi:hypothetical protein
LAKKRFLALPKAGEAGASKETSAFMMETLKTFICFDEEIKMI